MSKDILYPLRRLHGMVHDVTERRALHKCYRTELAKMFSENPKTVFLLMTPEGGNLGDQAIASAELQILKNFGINCVEITKEKLDNLRTKGLLNVLNGYPLLITGGGNLGTIWIWLEYFQRDIIKYNPASPIFILPNTIYYGSSAEDQNEFQKSIELYNHHKHLYLYAREHFSYDVMSKAYRNVKLIPDMVLSLNKCGSPTNRKGCILTLRDDREKTRTEAEEAVLRQQVQNIFGDHVKNLDMCLDHGVLPHQREVALENQFSSFSQAELVVTDRLHGMIFCAITGTPCIVINSKSHKVRGCYEWIRNLDYIRFADHVEDITTEYEKIPQGVHIYDNSQLQHYYQELVDDILTVLKPN